MGFVLASNVTGQGSQSLGGLVNVTEVAAKVEIVAQLATVVGTAPFRRFHRQAWYALAINADAGPFAGLIVVTWHRFVELELETTLPIGGVIALADTLYWDVFDGGEMTFEIDW
jgi:hypothetical protein